MYKGRGEFFDTTHINIHKNDGSVEKIESTKTIIATGSKPGSLPFINIDKERVITSLSFKA